MIDTLRAYRAVVRLPGMSGLLFAAGLSRLAGRMFMLVIVLYALDRFHSPALAGWLAFASLAPGFAVSPLAGALLDRMGSARGIMANIVASAALLIAFVVADSVGSGSTPLLFAIVTLYSLTRPLNDAGVRGEIPRIAPPAMLDHANALDTTIYALADIVGPAVAGVLFGYAGAQATLLSIAACFAVAAVGLRPVLGSQPARDANRRDSLFAEALAGLRYVFGNPTLRGVALAYALYQASWGALLVIVPVMVQARFGPGPVDDAVVGALWTGAGIAGAIGALLTGHARTDERERTLIAAGMLATALAIYPLSAQFGLAGLVVGLAILGFCEGPIDVGVLSVRQRRIEPGWMGRALAVSMGLNMSGLPIGSAIGGWIVGASVQWALVVAALLAAAGALAAYRLVPPRRV